MKRKSFLFVAFVAMSMLSASTAWAQYVKVTAEDGTVSWAEIKGTVNGTNFEIYKTDYQGAIDMSVKGAIDLGEVWSESGGNGTHYQVTKIKNYAFYGRNGLTSVVIPTSVTNIGLFAFYGCSGLTSVYVPSSVIKMESGAFAGCRSLESIVVDAENPNYNSVNNCNAIIRTSDNTLLFGCKNTVIPNTVTSIGVEAFHNCSDLTSIEFPSSVKIINDYAFRFCTSLTSVKIPSTLTYLSTGAFNGCTGLTEVEISPGVTTIGSNAFLECTNLPSIVIPSTVTSIGVGAFSGCSSLASIVVDAENPNYYSANNCNAIIETSSNTLITGCMNTIIPNFVTTIGKSAFSGCSGLTFMEIPSSVTSIKAGAFGKCFGLTSIVIPASVTNIEDNVFIRCSALTSITSYITDVFETGNNAFYGCDNATLYVPTGLVSTYQSTKYWSSISNIEEMPAMVPILFACNDKGKVFVNGLSLFTNNIGEVNVKIGADNKFVFQPNEDFQLRQVLLDGVDVTQSVENNQLITMIQEGSKMFVTFDKVDGDMNGDGAVDISDVVAIVNVILGQ